LMASKASEEGKASSRRISLISSKRRAASSTVLERHGEWEAVKLLGVRKGSSSWNCRYGGVAGRERRNWEGGEKEKEKLRSGIC
jgi:hypothetical protein